MHLLVWIISNKLFYQRHLKASEKQSKFDKCDTVLILILFMFLLCFV